MTIESFGVGPIASWLIEVYVFATILLIAAGLAMFGLKQPADRLSVARATFVALALLGPLVAACRWVRSSRTLADPSSRTATSALTPIDGCCPPTGPEATSTDIRTAAIVGFFAGGSGLTVGWLVLGAIASARLQKRSRPAPEELRSILVRVTGQGGATPRLLVGTGVAQPVAFGLIRPAIVLPERFAESETAPRIESALAHEWAHLENGDLRFLALSRLLLPLMFAHPLFAWLRRKVRADQEALADLAASRREGRIAYAEALVNWARSGTARGIDRTAPMLGLWDRPSALRRRIALLLDGDFRLESETSRKWRLAVGAFTVSCLVGVALGGPVVESFGKSADGTPHAHRHVSHFASPGCEIEQPNVNVYCCPSELKPGM